MFDRLRSALEDFFGDDLKRISHALDVYSYSMRIQEHEGGERDIVEMAALFHDVGIRPAEELYGTSAAPYQERLGPPVVERLLTGLGIPEDKISRVKEIVASHHTPGKVNTPEFACIWDADLIVNLKDREGKPEGKAIEEIIEKHFMTDWGKRIAREVLLK